MRSGWTCSRSCSLCARPASTTPRRAPKTSLQRHESRGLQRITGGKSQPSPGPAAPLPDPLSIALAWCRPAPRALYKSAGRPCPERLRPCRRWPTQSPAGAAPGPVRAAANGSGAGFARNPSIGNQRRLPTNDKGAVYPPGSSREGYRAPFLFSAVEPRAGFFEGREWQLTACVASALIAAWAAASS